MDKPGEVNRHTVSYILLLSLLLLLCSGCNRKIASGQQSFIKNQMACDNLFNRAVAHEIDGEYETATSDFTKILENNPENVSSYYHRALLWGRIGKMVMAFKSRIAAGSNPI